MSERNLKGSRSTLTDDQYIRCLGIVVEYLKHNENIRNRKIREITGIGYDQAIHFFGRATEDKNLLREGVGSGTHYVLASRKGRSR